MPLGHTGPSSAARPPRADARRNRERIVAAATAAIAEEGAAASLEEIARRARVGSATLHRHFPTRQSLLEAVFSERVAKLCARARELAGEPDPGAALVAWLRAVAAHCSGNRGLAAALTEGARDGDPEFGATCHAMITRAGDELLTPAHRVGAARADIAIEDLLTLVNAIAMATEREPDGSAAADRLVDLVIHGVLAPTADQRRGRDRATTD